MPTVHPCRHAAVLKTMSDSMSEGGHQIESHFALLIFLKFISSVIPYVEFSRDLKGMKPLILDTSSIIDGRLAELVDTGAGDFSVVPS